MSLTIEHIAAYLPYGVQSQYLDYIGVVGEVVYRNGRGWLIDNGNIESEVADFKLILRPMSDAPYFYERKGMAVMALEAQQIYHRLHYASDVSHKTVLQLQKDKFDYDGLIPQGLAVSCHDVGVDYE